MLKSLLYSKTEREFFLNLSFSLKYHIELTIEVKISFVNVQVTILVLDAEGQPLEGALFGAAGTEGSSEYQSLVIYHHNSPTWAETVRLAIPIDKFYGSHVRLEFRHCSSKSEKCKVFFIRIATSQGI